MIKPLVFWLLFILMPFLLPAQEIRDYLSAPFPTNLTASKDGRTMAWVFNEEGNRNIYLAEAATGNYRKLTDFKGDNGLSLGSLQFSPDGQLLVYSRGNSRNSKGEAANPAQLQMETGVQFYAVHLASGKTKKIGAFGSVEFSHKGDQVILTKGGKAQMATVVDTGLVIKDLFSLRGSISNIAWSPDDQRLAFVNSRGSHSYIGIYHFEPGQVFFPDASADNDRFPVWSPNGRFLAFIRMPALVNKLPFTPLREAYPWSIRLLETLNWSAQEIFQADRGTGSVFFDDLPAGNQKLWWANEDELVFPWEKTGWVQLYKTSLRTKKVDRLTMGNGEIENVELAADGSGLYLTHNMQDIQRRQVSFLDFKTRQTALLQGGETINTSPVPVNNGYVFLQSTSDRPLWPVLVTNNEAKLLAPELFPQDFPKRQAKPEAVKLMAKDGIESWLQVMEPTVSGSGKKPAIIFIHGGSRRQMVAGYHYSQYYSNAFALQQYFASQGFVAANLNYRSGIGYGLEFREAENYGAEGASEVLDVWAAAEYLRSRPDVDTGKIILWGGSYGGYLTAHALAQYPGRFLCGVDIHGVHNWNNDLPVFADWYLPERFPEMKDLAFKSSPMNFIDQWKEPVLLIHGDDDRNVLFSETIDLVYELRKRNVPVEILVFPDEVHSFLLHRNWVKAFEATANFAMRNLMNAASHR